MRSVQEARTHMDGVQKNGYSLATLWRAQAWQEGTESGVTGPLRQAHVFSAMLMKTPVVINPGEALVGSTQGALSSSPPKGYEAAVDLAKNHVDLWFGVHSDHACPDYESLLQQGVGGILDSINQQNPGSAEQATVLAAMATAMRAFRDFIYKHARACESRGLLDQSQSLDHIAIQPPRTFWEALQLVWLVDLAFSLEGRGAMAFGRMDQYLSPFYERDLAAGRLNREMALLLIGHFYVKLGEPLRFNPINNISIGGLCPDGTDGTNELSTLFLEAAAEVRWPFHNLTARWHHGTPRGFKLTCLKLIKTGIGFPAIVNDDLLTRNLLRLGIRDDDAFNSCFVGCIETFIPGKTGPWADSRFNLLKVLEDLLAEMVEQDSLPASYPEFEAMYLARLEREVIAHAESIRQLESEVDYWEKSLPFLSALTQDCIGRAADINMGGAIYPGMHGIGGMGLATVADSLNVIRVCVYQERRYSLAGLWERLVKNFKGFERDRLYMLNRVPKYGNGDPEVDGIVKRVAAGFGQATLGQTNAIGGRFLPLLAANINNIAAGEEVGATPDGRRGGVPVSDAASPHFGRDRESLAGVIASLSQVDYYNSIGGNVVNMKVSFTDSSDRKEEEALVALVTTYFRQGGMQVQLNTVDTASLIQAQEDPEAYASLLVRVSGFSAYFTQLGREVQDDIIARTQHRLRSQVPDL